ncbi:carboxypeptidase-like regulatory domain-containing protein [Salinimicrobium oceani]|uniref:Carboxypeptidase-like regulatory domain-containing protein n=1 Tax=Salinimicrobium oceani TaxID=2722702 RepID=A0ABX1CW55_9FLAO|nr:carboxypeptidase-like regulatory domain-containing protein [Salinimicrobium oceani]NJW52518.1 carboxypeptidase-like regulatory domain-containing protein [Salinimicrobium oceani]
MKNSLSPYLRNLLVLFLFSTFSTTAPAMFQQPVSANFTEYKGKVVNSKNQTPLTSAYLSVQNTNVSTVTNTDGEFSLKVPKSLENVSISVSHLGYLSRELPLQFFEQSPVVIELQESMEQLDEVAIFNYTDPEALVKNMLKNRASNYFTDRTTMTGFYRESIKRGRKNVSLSEAVVKIHKQPYDSNADDDISLVKARKTADYDRLDTLALKLRGGPYNPLSLDIMKNPTHIFNEKDLSNFRFSFDPPTKIDDQYLYVVNFEELGKELPWYFGKLFIDAETFTLVKATFNLNVDNRSAATNLFVKKKPGGTKVYPVEVNYDITYRQNNGRWYFGYGHTELEFVVNWRRKLFNSRYRVNSELAVTDWKINTESRTIKDDSFLNRRVIMNDDVSGFRDVAFWGENNIIEPDESIESAIEKIRNKLENN